MYFLSFLSWVTLLLPAYLVAIEQYKDFFAYKIVGVMYIKLSNDLLDLVLTHLTARWGLARQPTRRCSSCLEL